LAWYRRSAEGWVLRLHVQPGAKKSEVLGPHGEALKIRIAAPPVEGQANAALIAYLAGRLGVRKGAISVLGGQAARQKTVLVADAQAQMARLHAG
jgi:uncharacterized protein (TIGR00251 family)